MGTKKIEIEVPEGKTAEWIEGVLKLVDEKDTRPVTERVKTFEDACKELGEYHPLVRQWHGFENNILSSMCYTANDIVAYMKLRIICAALNEGWEPKFTKEEWRYFPWFYLYTEDVIKDMGEEEKNDMRIMDTGNHVTEYTGFASAESVNGPSRTTASIGSRLCLKSNTLASYCGKQFIDIWADFNMIRK